MATTIAFAGEKYQLDIDGQLTDGTTGGHGMIEKKIPADCPEGKLTVWFANGTARPGVSWNLKMGHAESAHWFHASPF
jgi:hypothetical protein